MEYLEDKFDIIKLFAWIFVIGCLLGFCVLGWAFLFGPWSNQIDYNNFNSSPTHMNAVAQKLSNDCLQLAETTDPTAKKALEQDINYQVATVDVNKLVMPSSVRSCVNTSINDVNRSK